MEYKKIVNLLDNSANQSSKFRTRNSVKINDESRGTYTGSYIKFKTTMLRSNLCDYADAYILVKGTIPITGEWDDAAARQPDERYKGLTFRNCTPFTKCISIFWAVSMSVLFILNYSKTSGGLWQYYKDEPNYNLADSESFKSKVKITGKTPAAGNTKDIEIIVPMKYFSNFRRTFERSLINCEVNHILAWFKDCVITNSVSAKKFAITDTKLYVPAIQLYQLNIMQNYFNS